MKKLSTTLYAFALLLSSYVSEAQTPAAPEKAVISPTALHKLDSLFRYLDSTGFYNGNILVAAGGEKRASAAIGYANLATKEHLTESSTFELASVSKQFTAVGILCLIQAGKLTLNQKLETLFPSFPYKGVSIRNLLNHTCGLPDYIGLFHEHWDKSRIATNNDVMAMLIKHHPKKVFEPGTRWEYSNTGYALLASVIEKVSAKSYADYMREAVFAPLHLEQTQVYMRRYAPRQIEGYAYGYVQGEDGSFKLPDSVKEYGYVHYLDGITGDGTVNTTAGDLLLWNNAVRDRKLVSPALWIEAITPPVINGKSTDYGFGFMVKQNLERGLVLMHTGGWPGYHTNNVLYLDKDVSLIYLSNKEESPDLTEAVYAAVKNIVFDKPAEFPKPLVQQVAEVDKSLYKLYTGTYTSSEMKGFELIVREKGGNLSIQATGQAEIEVKPEAANKFFVPDFPISLEFMPNDGKPAATLVLLQNGKHEFKRKP